MMILEIHLEKVGTQKKSLRSIIYSFRRIRDILRKLISTASKRFKIKEVNPSINRVRRMLTSEEILRKIEENIDEIKRFGVKRIGLFGSYVRGEQRAESDVDILVEFEKGKATFDNFLDPK